MAVEDALFAELDDGEVHITPLGMSALFGVPVEKIKALHVLQGSDLRAIPQAWIKSGIQRRQRFQAETGVSNPAMRDALLWWARRDGLVSGETIEDRSPQ